MYLVFISIDSHYPPYSYDRCVHLLRLREDLPQYMYQLVEVIWKRLSITPSVTVRTRPNEEPVLSVRQGECRLIAALLVLPRM